MHWTRPAGVLFLVALVAMGCGTDDPKPEPSPYQRVEHGGGRLALYVPSAFHAETTTSTGVAGFRIENIEDELLAAVVRSTASRLPVSGSSGSEVTAPSHTRTALDQITRRLRREIQTLLPQAKAEGDGWRLNMVKRGETVDRRGNPVTYGHFQMEFAPAYQLRSFELFHFLAKQILDVQWRDFPENRDRYYPAGSNVMEFLITIAFHPAASESGEFDQNQVDVGIATYPFRRTRGAATLQTIDTMLAFKTLGSLAEEESTEDQVFEVTPQGPPIDLVILVDTYVNMKEEAARVREALVELVEGFAENPALDYRVAVLTHHDPSFLVMDDGKRYLSSSSKDAADQLDAALQRVWRNWDAPDFTTARNSIRRNAIRAFGEDTVSNHDFARPDAPRLLLTISDRDDDSPETRSDTAWAEEMRSHYTEWFAIHASQPNCTGPYVNSTAAGRKLFDTARTFGGFMYDLCRVASHPQYIREIRDYVALSTAPFRFEAPLPLPMTLRVFLNGVPLEASADGFQYDLFADRLVFAPGTSLREGDVITSRYLTLQPRIR